MNRLISNTDLRKLQLMIHDGHRSRHIWATGVFSLLISTPIDRCSYLGRPFLFAAFVSQ